MVESRILAPGRASSVAAAAYASHTSRVMKGGSISTKSNVWWIAAGSLVGSRKSKATNRLPSFANLAST